METAVKLENVSTIYEGERRPAIKDINLILERGELVYIVGPNAAGKTTLIETINGLLPAFKGKVSVLGLDVKTHGCHLRRRIGYVPQDFMKDPGEPYRALDVVLMGRYGMLGFLQRPSKEDHIKASEAMRLFGVDHLADRPIGKLSGGQQQKVMLARAIAKDPEILLLDEPFSNLDPESRVRITQVIGEIHEEKDLTTIIVSHDVHNISKICCRAIVMVDGRIVGDGEPEEVLETIHLPWDV
ncbi:MAG: metal ABC transporter ATP-binding protein [Nitrososphaerota archaeon]|nr:metal ABC transporter ATP-binding protein [Candidatus Bathyarchaeota archaeon]MDW8048564.1 metal ABC transporter ATP-binding protein [Nitrososphaerota archaeon]